MAYDKLVDSTKLDSALKNTANAIRGKTGKTANIAWNETTGFKTAVDEIVVGNTIKAQSKRVTPTKAEQTVTPDSGYNALSVVTVEAIPDNYIEPSGTLQITKNGSHNVTSYASVNVNVPAVGVELPNLDNPGSESDMLQGRELLNSNGEVVVGTMPNHYGGMCILDGVEEVYRELPGGHYDLITVRFDSSAIEALLDAV